MTLETLITGEQESFSNVKEFRWQTNPGPDPMDRRVEYSRLPVPKKPLQDNHQEYAHYGTHNRSAPPVKHYNTRPVSMVPSESTPFIPIYGINCNDGVYITNGIRHNIICNFHYLHIYCENCSTSSKETNRLL